MNIINKYKAVIVVVLPILILVFIRSVGNNHFKRDAKRWAEPSVVQSNIISDNKIDSLPGEKLIINLGKEKSDLMDKTRDVLFIHADSILLGNNLKSIRKHNGPVLLYSSDMAVSAKIWMVLGQMGYRNVYILSSDIDNEILKNEFRPDSIVRPELRVP